MNKLVEVSLVVGGGALGGLASVMQAWADPVSYPLSIATLFAIFVTPAVKGGLAGGIGVYVLVGIDPTNIIRVFFFAVACGLAFPSVLAKGGGMVDSVTSQVAQHVIDKNASKIARIAASAATGEETVDVQDIKIAATNIIKAEPKVRGVEKSEAESALQQAVSTLGGAAAKGVAVAAQTITEIGALSAVRGLQGPKETAIQELKVLYNSPQLDQPLRSTAEQGLKMLERPVTWPRP